MSWRTIAACDSLRCNTTVCHGSWKACTHRCMHAVLRVALCKQVYSHASPPCVGVVIQRKCFSAQQMPKHTNAHQCKCVGAFTHHGAIHSSLVSSSVAARFTNLNKLAALGMSWVMIDNGAQQSLFLRRRTPCEKFPCASCLC
jgi:hypothetical protein